MEEKRLNNRLDQLHLTCHGNKLFLPTSHLNFGTIGQALQMNPPRLTTKDRNPHISKRSLTSGNTKKSINLKKSVMSPFTNENMRLMLTDNLAQTCDVLLKKLHKIGKRKNITTAKNHNIIGIHHMSQGSTFTRSRQLNTFSTIHNISGENRSP